MPKITELPQYLSTDISMNDVFPVVDITQNITKQSTIGEISTYFTDNLVSYTGWVTEATGSNDTKVATNQFVYNSKVDTVNTVKTSKYVAKAWANFDGTQPSGTYIQSANTITIVMSAHGMSQGDFIQLDFTSGVALDGVFNITSITDVNTFVITAASSLATSGNVTRLVWLKSSYNVSSITKITSGYGRYIVQFSTPMNDSRYSVVGSGSWMWQYAQAASVYVPMTSSTVYVRKDQNAFALDVCDQDTITDTSGSTSDINVIVFGN